MSDKEGFGGVPLIHDEDGRRSESTNKRPGRTIIILSTALAGSWMLILCMLVAFRYARLSPREDGLGVYSPASEAIRYQKLKGSTGVGEDRTPYMGPPAEQNDQEWAALYNFGMSRISTEEAAQLTNKTAAIPDDPGHYIVTLTVFHNLHCLNMMRRRIWSHIVPIDPELRKMQMSDTHMNHCIDSIRQALMCSADITPVWYQWDEGKRENVAVTGTLRVCRDFEALQAWGRTRESTKWNSFVHVEED